MGVFGTIMKIIMIVLVAALAVFVILGAILMIFPSVSIFGLHYVTSDNRELIFEELDESSYSTWWDEADVIRVETGGYDINVRVTTTGQTGENYNNNSVKINSAYKGFVWGDVWEPTYSSTITDEKYLDDRTENVFYVKMAEPTGGFLIRSETVLDLIVSSNALDDKTLEVVTNTGTITIGGDDITDDSTKINTKELVIESQNGQVNLNNYSVEDALTVTKNSGNVKSLLDIPCTTTISITGGYGLVELENLGNEASQDTLVTMNTTNTHTVIKNIYGDFDFTAEGGLLEVENISGYANLVLGSCDCRVATVGNGLDANGGDGYLRIERVNGNSTLVRNNGETTIGENTGWVNFSSANGSLTLSSCFGDVTATSTYGNIAITCKDAFNITINNRHGNTNFTDAQGLVLINTSTEFDNRGTGTITGSFAEVLGQNIINAYAGNVNLTIPQNDFALGWRNISGAVNIGMGSLSTTAKTTSEYLQDTSSTTQKWVNVITGEQTENSANSILVTNNSGQINITPVS